MVVALNILVFLLDLLNLLEHKLSALENEGSSCPARQPCTKKYVWMPYPMGVATRRVIGEDAICNQFFIILGPPPGPPGDG